jgi:hypothetical protein
MPAHDLTAEEVRAVQESAKRIRAYWDKYLQEDQRQGRRQRKVVKGGKGGRNDPKDAPTYPVTVLAETGRIDWRRDAALCSLAYVYALGEIRYRDLLARRAPR